MKEKIKVGPTNKKKMAATVEEQRKARGHKPELMPNRGTGKNNQQKLQDFLRRSS